MRGAVPIGVALFVVLGLWLVPGILIPPAIGSGYFLQWILVPAGLVVAAVAAEVWARVRLPRLREDLARLQLEFDQRRFLEEASGQEGSRGRP